MIFRLSLALLRLFARIVPSRQRDAWLREWESEFRGRRARLAARDALTPRQEVDMFQRVLGSFHDAAWLRRQFTLDADLMHDVRYGARLLRRTPGFTLLAVTVLALGIGATTGIFSVVEALLIRELPYREPERIVLLFEAAAARRTDLEEVAPANFLDWQNQARSFEVMAAAEAFGFTYTGGAEPQSLPGMRVSKGFFEAFGVDPLYGRTFTPEEFTAGHNRVAVLSFGTWAQRFGADRGIVGATIRLNGQPVTVVGVMPPTFAPRLLLTFNERGVWMPKIWSESDTRLRGTHFYNVVARLKPDVTIAQAQAELGALGERLGQQYPRTNAGKTIQVVSLRDHLAGDLRASLGVLAAAVFLLLVIAMANTANLLMARSAARAREIAVRSAIGADRGRLMRQMLAETLLLAALGCLLGLLVAYGCTRIIVLLAPADIPALGTLGVNGRVLLFSTALTFIVTILVGIVPAWRGTRARVVDALSASGDPRVAHGGRGRARFVIAELAVALVLLAAGGLLLRSFSSLLETSPGFRPEGVAAVQVFVRLDDPKPPQVAAFVQQIVNGMRTLPQVNEVGAASAIPFLDTTGGSEVAILIEGRPAPAAGDEPSALVNVATPGYFAAMRIPVLDGRTFDEHDNADRAPVAIVSRTFAETHWRGRSPVGQRIQFTVRGTQMNAEVVGVVGDVQHEALDRAPSQEVFVAHAQLPVTDMTFVARTSGDPATLVGGLKSQIYAVAPNRPVYRTAVLQDLVGSTLNDRRFMLTLVLAFALLAVALAASGVYGVMSAVSTERTREYGLRVALGAGRGEILRMVMRDGATIALVGIAIGLIGALTTGQLLRRFLFGIGPTDVWTLMAVSATLAAVAGLACLLPALRATRVSPLAALRTE